jgi:hypothetical protein
MSPVPWEASEVCVWGGGHPEGGPDHQVLEESSCLLTIREGKIWKASTTQYCFCKHNKEELENKWRHRVSGLFSWGHWVKAEASIIATQRKCLG